MKFYPPKVSPDEIGITDHAASGASRYWAIYRDPAILAGNFPSKQTKSISESMVDVLHTVYASGNTEEAGHLLKAGLSFIQKF